MPKDKTASHARVLAAAREEFLTYGFEKASMRRIGEKCALTAAGLYRHCRDKEELLEQLVQPAISRLDDWQSAHISHYIAPLEKGELPRWRDSWVDMMREAVYPYMDDFYLLLTRSQGTKYEHFLHDLTQKAQREMLEYMPLLKEKGFRTAEVAPREMHLLMSAYITALFEPVIDRYPPEEALQCLNTVEAFFLPGWKKLFGF